MHAQEQNLSLASPLFLPANPMWFVSFFVTFHLLYRMCEYACYSANHIMGHACQPLSFLLSRHTYRFMGLVYEVDAEEMQDQTADNVIRECSG